MIRAGELAPGTVLPGEHEMATQYGVGREAVRKALGVLRAEGLVATNKGEGSQVRVQPERKTLAIDSKTRVWFRLTTPEERIMMGLDEGVGLVVVEAEGVAPRLLPSDEVIITGK
ncbi:GntR family transcriptional regulator [Microtetraspora sp. AC03309]|nr:GntR family transcriptional regulator [Microtetraspora sp. AC03309]